MSRVLHGQRVLLLVVLCCVVLGGCGRGRADAGPSVSFTKVPGAGEGGPEVLEGIAGRVSGAQPGQRIVLFARSGVWWVQPYAEQPFTEIRADSTWSAETHIGTEYAALLVAPEYKPPATTDELPRAGGPIVAVASVAGEQRTSTPDKTLSFSGYEWVVRSVPSDRGGATNNYDPANAWTDAEGALHLRISGGADGTGGAGKWKCAEVRLTRSLGYGSYRFVVRDTSQLEPAAVFGMFTWDEQEANQNHREMDVEITRWGDPGNKNAQYVVQPFYVPANVHRFAAPAGALTHTLRWEPGRASFRTVRGTGQGNAQNDAAGVVAEHVFTSGVPTPGGETVRMNLYVFGGGAAHALRREAEVVVEKFEYLP